MTSSSSSDSSAPQRTSVSEAEVIMRMLGTDPWMRFYLWAARAWEAAEKANELALATAPPISSDDAMFDPRVAALFHASEIAKEFSQMTNPLTALGGAEFGYDVEPSEENDFAITMLVENEDTDTD